MSDTHLRAINNILQQVGWTIITFQIKINLFLKNQQNEHNQSDQARRALWVHITPMTSEEHEVMYDSAHARGKWVQRNDVGVWLEVENDLVES